jgi:hypothetical protein
MSAAMTARLDQAKNGQCSKAIEYGKVIYLGSIYGTIAQETG